MNSGASESYSYAGDMRISRNNIWTVSRDNVANEMSYYLYDGRGSVTANTWYNGMVTNVYQYDPYGQVTLGSTEHRDFYGYNGESYNPNSGLEYLRSRYYNADKGRFFQEDSYLGDVTEPLTLNRYAYVKNSPLNYVDPSGHRAKGLNGASRGVLNATDMMDYGDGASLYPDAYDIPEYVSIEDMMRQAEDDSDVITCLQSFTIGMTIGMLQNEPLIRLAEIIINGHNILSDIEASTIAEYEAAILNSYVINKTAYYTGKMAGNLFAVLRGVNDVKNGFSISAGSITAAPETAGLSLSGVVVGIGVMAEGTYVISSSAINSAADMAKLIESATSGSSGAGKAQKDEDKRETETEKTVTNSAGQEVTRKYVKDQDELLKMAEEAAGGSLDDWDFDGENQWTSPDKSMKIEWNPDGHANTNEGPHVTIRTKNSKGGYSVTDKYFIENWDNFKRSYGPE